MTVALLVMTDGRVDCITRTLASFDQMVTGPVTRRIIHDDSGDLLYTAWLLATYGHRYTVVSTPGRSGFGGAIQSGWRHLAGADERFVFHLEDDFVFTRPVDLDVVAAVLDCYPHLTQMALRRQPWNEQERAAGGVVEQHPDDYAEVTDAGCVWLEHRRFWTTNPSLYRRSLCQRGWPTGPNSEGRFGIDLFGSDPTARAGFWGARDSGVWVEHIGAERVGVGY